MLRGLCDRNRLAKCQSCGKTLSEWFVCYDDRLDKMVMWCADGCRKLSQWETHMKYREEKSDAS